ncbi:PEGA domain-containing protein, partial [bacterium]|nr:PEGA domain-containing protein [bacterium]
MTITQRRLYLLFFIILFFLTAPVIVLFAKGYRFDTVNNIFVYSGSITIKSAPRDIDIYVDNKKQKKSKLSVINGSYTLNGIRPGKHTIACKKEGYTSWSKTINVHSGISTEFWNILLLPNT